MRAALVAALVIASTLPGSVRAQPAYEALFFDDVARQAYAARRYDDAYTSFAQLAGLIASPGTLYNLGLCADLAAHDSIAFSHLSEYVATADADETRRQDAERRLAALRERLALVSVQSDPPGAEIRVVGMDVGDWGLTPRTIALPAGEHAIRVERDRRSVGEITVSAVVGQVVEVELDLPLRTGVLRVESETPNALVVAAGPDGEEARGAVGEAITLGVGNWELTVSSPETEDVELAVQITEGSAQTRAVQLPARQIATGRLMVDSNGVVARVFVDGHSRAETPATIGGVPAGDHDIRVEANGYFPWSGRVQVPSEATRFLDVTLVPEVR